MVINRRTIIALGLAFTLLATPAAAQPYQDLRNPDNRPTATLSQDVRSPDTRDLANGYAPQPDGPVTQAPATVEATSTGASIDWTTTLLAAGGYLLAIAAGAFALRSRSRSHRRVAA